MSHLGPVGQSWCGVYFYSFPQQLMKTSHRFAMTGSYFQSTLNVRAWWDPFAIEKLLISCFIYDRWTVDVTAILITAEVCLECHWDFIFMSSPLSQSQQLKINLIEGEMCSVFKYNVKSSHRSRLELRKCIVKSIVFVYYTEKSLFEL